MTSDLPEDSEDTRISTPLTQSIAAPKEASFVQIYGPHLGKRYIIDRFELTIGRDAKHHIVLDSDNVSRDHARIVVDGKHVRFEDLGSTNGSLINDQEVETQILRSGDIVKIGSVILKFLTGGSAEALYHEEIYRMTIHDGLLDIANRRYFEDFLDREFARASRYDRPLTLMLFDIDHFKKVNDTYGHLAGDYVLRLLATTLAGNIRREELLARYGGEEFVLVMPETRVTKAKQYAEKIRRTIEGTEFTFDGRDIAVTTSVGLSELTQGMDRQTLIQQADEALYRAKENGRNQVCIY